MVKKSFGLVVILGMVVTLLLGACAQKAPSFSPEVAQQMRQVVEEAMAEDNIPGAVVGVWVPGEGTWVKAIGKANIETGRDIESTDKFRIASITKTFTATVILQLVDEGKLSLDDTLNQFVPEVPDSDKITIRQLCNMTSGIFGISEDEGFYDTLVNDPLKKWTHRELLDVALKHDPYFPPGEGWHYSDTNYTPLLGMIIEQVTGNKVEEEIQTRIVEPLGLKDTSLPEEPYMSGEYSHGYMLKDDGGELVDITETDPSAPWTGGAMISNLDDLKVWAKALADGRLLSETAHEEQLTWVDMPGMAAIGGQYGLGISSVAGFLGHNGEILGYNSVMYYLPSRDATIIVLLNKCYPGQASVADEIFVGIAKILFPDQMPVASHDTQQEYLNAVTDAKVAEPDEISRDLSAVVAKDNPTVKLKLRNLRQNQVQVVRNLE